MQQPQTHPYRDHGTEADVQTSEVPVVRGATLESWLAHAWDRGIQVDELDGLQALRVRTRNSTYELAVMQTRPGEVLVRGGRYFPEWTRVHLAGSTLGGGFLKRYGVHLGLRMEFYWQGRRVVTSPVHGIECLAAAPTAC